MFEIERCSKLNAQNNTNYLFEKSYFCSCFLNQIMSQSRKIIKNFVWLSIAEFATKGISFFNNAYLARVILADGYGKINFAIATVSYFVTFVTLGLNVVGAREVARNPESKVFFVNSIISIRLLLSFFAFVGYFGFIWINNFSDSQTLILIIASLYILSSVFTIDWYYQGIEKMEVLAIRQFLIATLNFIGIVAFVHTPDDVVIAIVVMACSTLLNTLLILIPYFHKTRLFAFNFNFTQLIPIVKDAVPVSLSQLLLVFLSSSSIILIGILLPLAETKLGIYTAANKLMVLLFLPITVIQIVFYPYFSKADELQERQKAYEKYITLNIIIGVFLATFFFLFAENAIELVYGNNYTDSIILLKLMMLIVMMSYISQTAIHPLIAWKKEKQVLKIIFLAAIINLILNAILLLKLDVIGAVWANIVTEIFLMLSFIFIIRKNIQQYPFILIGKILLIGLLSAFLAHQVLILTNSIWISIITSLITYFFIILVVKIITIKEIKGYLKR